MGNKKIIILYIIIIILIGGIIFYREQYKAAVQSQVKQPTESQTSKEIVIDSPMASETISSPLLVSGRARGSWFFEGSFPINVLNDQGAVIASAQAQADGEWMTTDFVPFKATITIPSSFHGAATLRLQNDNPSGLPENSKTESLSIFVK